MVFHFPVAFNTLLSLFVPCTYPYPRTEMSTDGEFEGGSGKNVALPMLRLQTPKQIEIPLTEL